MKIITEVETRYDFEFWSGAKDTVKYLTDEEVETIFAILEEIYPNGMTETELNDFFWFEDGVIAEWLGYNDFVEIMERYEREWQSVCPRDYEAIINCDSFTQLDEYATIYIEGLENGEISIHLSF